MFYLVSLTLCVIKKKIVVTFFFKKPFYKKHKSRLRIVNKFKEYSTKEFYFCSDFVSTN